MHVSYGMKSVLKRKTKKRQPFKLLGDDENNFYDGHWKMSEKGAEKPFGKGI